MDCVLQKFPGKGGWTYVRLPGIKYQKNERFGWMRVKGTIDNYAIKAYNLMPFGNGELFLPVKAEIRNKIGKQHGDTVSIILFADNAPIEIPDELLLCLKDEPAVHAFFLKCTMAEQKRFIDWIYSAKQLNTRSNRIAKCIALLQEGKRL
jgi:hypothetical protein